MLTGKQKGYLRSLAQNVHPVLHIGKPGITDSFVHAFNDAVKAHELIKISVLQNCPEPKTKLAVTLSRFTDSELVQIIGNQLIFYRENINKSLEKRIRLPK